MLVTFEIMQTIKPISENNQRAFNQISQETEDIYLLDYLGPAFALDVQSNPSNYSELLEGVVFKDCNDNDIKFNGLYYILSYFIHADYSWLVKFKDTHTGQVTKTRTEADAITQGQESQLKNRSRKIAEHQVEVMKLYLNENLDNYTLWNCTNARPYTPKYTGIKRTRS